MSHVTCDDGQLCLVHFGRHCKLCSSCGTLIGTLENSESVDTIIADDGFEVTCVSNREDSTHLNKNHGEQ